MKKRIGLMILVCMLASMAVFAANNQKVYSVEDDAYKTVKSIYLLTGHALPSTTGPWSAAELEKMLAKIPESEIPAEIKGQYDSLMAELNHSPKYQWGGIGADLKNNFNLVLGYHTNNASKYSRIDYYSAASAIRTYLDDQYKDAENYRGADFYDGLIIDLNKISAKVAGVGTDSSQFNLERLFWGRDNWASKYVKNDTPVWGLELETYVGDNIYTFFDFGLYNSRNARTLGNDEYPVDEYGSAKIGSNIFLFQNFKFDVGLMDANLPYRAFLSFGDKDWNVQLGRDKISWGAGKTGNLVISNNMPYQDFLKFSTFGNSFKYTFLASTFAHPQDYFRNVGGSTVYQRKTGQDGTDGLSMYMSHRIEARFLHDKLNANLTEAIMYESKNNHLDLHILNPFFIWHNLYTPDTANSTLCFEVDGTPIKGLNLYGQFLVDEFAIPLIETAASADERSTPSRYGYLFGATYAMPLFDGVLTANAEYAKIDPYTYLRRNSMSGENGLYGLDYSVAVRQWSTAAQNVTWDEYIQGYTYGPDSKVANVNLDFVKDKLNISLNFLFASKGTVDQWTKTGDTGGSGKDDWKKFSTSPTTGHEADNWRYGNLPAITEEDYPTLFGIDKLHKGDTFEQLINDNTKDYTDGGFVYQSAKSRDAVQQTIDCGIAASYQILDNLKVFGQFDYVMIKNAFNISGQNDHDSQFVLGAKYTL